MYFNEIEKKKFQKITVSAQISVAYLISYLYLLTTLSPATRP